MDNCFAMQPKINVDVEKSLSFEVIARKVEVLQETKSTKA